MAKVEIKESKIRQVIWMRKKGRTKKDCCAHLGIAYNPKRLDKIIEEFRASEQREKELKEKNRKKVLTDADKDAICKRYLEGDSQAGIARLNFISPQRVKAVLEERKIPIRPKGKGASKLPQVEQDYSKEIKVGDKVFISKRNFFGEVSRIYNKTYLDYLEKGKAVRTELKKADNEEREDVHYSINVVFEDKKQMNLRSAQELRNKILATINNKETVLYKVNRTDEFAGEYCFPRKDLYPVV